MKRIDGTSYVDAVHAGHSIRATGVGRESPFIHTCPDDVLPFIERYLGEHGRASARELKNAYDGPALRIPIGIALLVKQGKVKFVGRAKWRSPVFARRRGLLGRMFGR
ncbi:hypothetical protein ES706_05753 [subsurface metagenome]